MKSIPKLTTMKLLLAAVAATCLSAGPLNAQQVFAGRFTLPYEVRWGMGVVPAGEYQLTFNSLSQPTVAHIQEVHGKVALFAMAVRIDRRNVSGPSALILARQGNQSTVRELRLARLGLILSYEPQGPRNRKGVQEARAAGEIPILMEKE